jgi:hypothetical protein
MATNQQSSAPLKISWDLTRKPKDEIVDEIHEWRESYAQFDFDIERMFADLKSKEAQNPAPRAPGRTFEPRPRPINLLPEFSRLPPLIPKSVETALSRPQPVTKRGQARHVSGRTSTTGSIRIRVETIGYFLKRYREDIVRNKQKATGIDQQMREFEARLRRQMLREKLDQSDSDLVRESFEAGSMPQIHVSLGALQASKAPVYERVSGD